MLKKLIAYQSGARAIFRKMAETLSASPLPSPKDSNPTGLGEKPAADTDTNAASIKRSAVDNQDEQAAKKTKTEDGKSPHPRKKKVAFFIVYSGKGYLGMQKNPDAKTIEGDLLEAMVKAEMCTEEQTKYTGGWMKFQRAARTDKGVSAVGQVVSSMINVEDALEKLNSFLVPQIRVLAIKRTTKGFDSKQACCARTYTYTLPTFAFTPLQQMVKEDFRVTDDILQNVNELLSLYKGTHNFHNFTSGKKHDDRSAFRYIMEFEVGKPFIRDGLELAIIKVKGQSFMLHQIRKMIGMVIAVQRGYVGKEAMEIAWGPVKRDIPKAPAPGLLLEKLHYDWYNKKFGETHEKLNWDDFEDEVFKFKEEYIFPDLISTEKNDKSMLSWLSTLHLHHFGDITDFDNVTRTGVFKAHRLVQDERKAAQAADAEPGKEGEKQESTIDSDSAKAESDKKEETSQEEKSTDLPEETKSDR